MKTILFAAAMVLLLVGCGFNPSDTVNAQTIQQQQQRYDYSITSWGMSTGQSKPQQAFDFFCHYGANGVTTYIDKFTLGGIYLDAAQPAPWVRPIIFRVSTFDTNAPSVGAWQKLQYYPLTDSSSPPFQSNPMTFAPINGNSAVGMPPQDKNGNTIGRRALFSSDFRFGDSTGNVVLWGNVNDPSIVLHGPTDGICVSFDTETITNLWYFSFSERFHETLP